MDSLTLTEISLLIGAYLLGSVCSAIILSKLMGFTDPRSEGSNNPGATNVLRIAGKKAAALTLLGDALKGVIPVLVGHWLGLDPLTLALIAFSAFIGHCYPIFFGFAGGKGVATAFGSLFAFNWIWGLIVGAIWLFVAKVMKISSLSAIIAFIALPVIAGFDSTPEITVVFTLLSIILIWRHRSNIKRLIHGEED